MRRPQKEPNFVSSIPGARAIEDPGVDTVVAVKVGGAAGASSHFAKVGMEDMSDSVWQAVVASEDGTFFEHRGVNLKGLLRWRETKCMQC